MSVQSEITRITNEVSDQSDLIDEISTILEGKTNPDAGSGGLEFEFYTCESYGYGRYECIDLSMLDFLPLIIMVLPGTITEIPDMLGSGAQHRAICVRTDVSDSGGGKHHYVCLNEDEKYNEFTSTSFLNYTKNTMDSYNINGIRVYENYMTSASGGETYTAILIGRASE